MAFINQAVTVLQTLVIALGAGLAVWGVVTVSYTHLVPFGLHGDNGESTAFMYASCLLAYSAIQRKAW